MLFYNLFLNLSHIENELEVKVKKLSFDIEQRRYLHSKLFIDVYQKVLHVQMRKKINRSFVIQKQTLSSRNHNCNSIPFSHTLMPVNVDFNV